jgi:DNA-binding NarL/FixJ family response regulator
MTQQLSNTPITVLIVEDNAVTRRALCLSIEKEPALAVLDALDTVQGAIAWLTQQTVDILLVDLGLPDGSGIDVIRHCAQHRPDINVMVITTSSDQDSILDSIEAGAAGYILKDMGAPDITRALLDLQAGGSPISPTIARKVLARMRDPKAGGAGLSRVQQQARIFLTKREAAILDLIACGDSYSAVARQLALSVGTVQTHIKHIYAKLSVHSRGEAVYVASQRGLLQMDQLTTAGDTEQI